MEALSLVSSIIGDPKALIGLGRENIDDVISLLDLCYQELSMGPFPVVDVDVSGSDVYIVGDLHGDLITARRIAAPLLIDPSLRSGSLPIIVFLGDYVDRPPKDVPEGGTLTALYVLCQRIAYPDNVVLLRGNHEGADLTDFSPYHLPSELSRRFGSDRASELHTAFLRTFSALPLMARTSNGVICTHASFPREKDPYDVTPQDRDEIMRTIWGDPRIKAYGFSGRGMGYDFDENDLTALLERTRCRILVRGHDPPLQGIPLFEGRMLTITTSRIYRNEGVGGTLILKMENGSAPERVQALHLLDVLYGSFAEIGMRS